MYTSSSRSVVRDGCCDGDWLIGGGGVSAGSCSAEREGIGLDVLREGGGIDHVTRRSTSSTGSLRPSRSGVGRRDREASASSFTKAKPFERPALFRSIWTSWTTPQSLNACRTLGSVTLNGRLPT